MAKKAIFAAEMSAIENPWSKQAIAVAEELKTNISTGLSSDAAARLLSLLGPNTLPPPEPTPFWQLVLDQFKDLLVLILLAAAVISFILAIFEKPEDRLTAFVEPVVILAILIVNAAVGVIQEENAEAAIEKLKEYEAEVGRVIRDGRPPHEIPAADLVPGDIVEVTSGDSVPADMRLFELKSSEIYVDESMLTGESKNITKNPAALVAEDGSHHEKSNMLFSGTLVTKGTARGIVVYTGASTAIGDIHSDLQKKDEETKTPLQEKLDIFSEQLSKIIGVICIIVWIMNITHFTDPEHGGLLGGAIYYFKIAVALAVAAIPEGLPAVVTTCLALGTMKMAKKNAIVRNLPSVETLGCTTVICSDKTGTLTTNKMSVTTVLVIDDAPSSEFVPTFRSFSVEGQSWDPHGVVKDQISQQALRNPAADVPALAEVARISSLCNEASLKAEFKQTTSRYEYVKAGTATEAALLVMSEKLGFPDPQVFKAVSVEQDPPRRCVDHSFTHFWKGLCECVRTCEFDRQRKSMSSLLRVKSGVGAGSLQLLVKGAPDSVLERCTHFISNSSPLNPQVLRPSAKATILHQVEILSAQGLRVLAFAKIENCPDSFIERCADSQNFLELESHMTFVGLAAMWDPPRHEVTQALTTCRRAGIRVIVITGDAKETAEAICRKIGVFAEKENLAGKSFLGKELEKMDQKEQLAAVQNASLFSRVEPHHKLQLVELLKSQSEVVAMTGDGVNDAPALQNADIGVGMGSGTAVAKHASKMVLQDDNFATIVMAVEEGRAIYNNTKQFIRYLISSNIGEVGCIFITAAIGMPEVLIPVQLLWVNLVTDGLPATALGFNRPDADIMNQPPRGRNDPIIDSWILLRYFLVGAYVGIATVLGFIWWYLFYTEGPQIDYWHLTHFHSCQPGALEGPWAGFMPAHLSELMHTDNACAIFHSFHPGTMALSILVTIEMFNALNALSENQSLLSIPPWDNKWLSLAILTSFVLHFLILYVPFLQTVFSVAPLSLMEWNAVIFFSLPVILIDEVMKFLSRNYHHSRTSQPKKKL